MTAADAEVLLDAHVHFHAGTSRAAFLAAAAANLRAGAEQLAATAPGSPSKPDSRHYGLLLTESRGVDAFDTFAAEAGEAPPKVMPPDAWWFRPTDEDNAVWAVRSAAADQPVLLIAGRQLVTREGLEVLALGCRQTFDDGMELRRAHDAVIDAGGVPVVPWGFGKWWFGRGRLLAELIDTTDAAAVWFLGDNAGRPQLSRRPPLFERAAARGIFVLPGSDPLPLPGQVDKVGRCGFRMAGAFDPERPAASVLGWLRSCTAQPATFGRYEGLASFARDQLAMQRRKRGSTPGVEMSS